MLAALVVFLNVWFATFPLLSFWSFDKANDQGRFKLFVVDGDEVGADGKTPGWWIAMQVLCSIGLVMAVLAFGAMVAAMVKGLPRAWYLTGFFSLTAAVCYALAFSNFVMVKEKYYVALKKMDYYVGFAFACLATVFGFLGLVLSVLGAERIASNKKLAKDDDLLRQRLLEEEQDRSHVPHQNLEPGSSLYNRSLILGDDDEDAQFIERQEKSAIRLLYHDTKRFPS